MTARRVGFIRDEAGRVEIVRSAAGALPERVAMAARDWVADRRLGPDDRAAVQLGFAAAPETVGAMARAAEGVFDPAAQRVRHWIAGRCRLEGQTRALVLHDDFLAWCAGQGLPDLAMGAFGRRLIALGIGRSHHPRTRRSSFHLTLRPLDGGAGL